MAGSLSSANREIREAAQREEARRAAGVKRPRRLADLLLSQLEELNLEDVHQVPPRFEPMLGEMATALAPWPGAMARFGPRLRSGIPTAQMIDTIFAVQDLIAPTHEVRRSGAGDDDEVLEPERYILRR